MILEGIVTTLDSAGAINIAPMGPGVTPDFHRLTLRPYRTSQTFQNLKAHPEGVFHVIDDAEVLARAAVGAVEAELRPAKRVKGFTLTDACRAYEFRVLTLDEREERVTIEAEVVAREEIREFFGWNRAKHAVLEAAILASRADLLGREVVLEKLASLAVLVEKTGGPAERRAFSFLRDHVARPSPAVRVPAPAATVRVAAGSRLHFGLLAPGTGSPRRWGGAGLMVSRPAVVLTAEPSERHSASGPLAARALEIAERLGDPPCSIRIDAAPPQHMGLGTGTQLAMAVARAACLLRGESPSVAELAARTGRGRRSAIGVHGFERGGFLVDAGKEGNEGLAPLILRLEFPAEWRVVLASPTGETGLSGPREEEAFRGIEIPGGAPDALCRILLLGLIPALQARDFPSFAGALAAYGDRAGECFAKEQGGVYSSPKVARIVELARSAGAPGSGQTSWGPTVYALAEDPDRAASIAGAIQGRFGGGVEVVVAEPLNRGAQVEVPGIPSAHTLAI